MKKISLLAAVLTLALSLTACGTDGKPNSTPTPVPTLKPELTEGAINAAITLESGDEISLELYPKVAPKTVDNFVDLAEDGFYDGLIFHRVIEDFMIQGGGYDENLKEQKASTIEGEFSANGVENPLSHTRGVISMARAQQFDTASSQFFIVQADSTYLDGQYAAFGMVTDGMDVVDDIASERTGSVTSSGMENVPVNPIVIESITIEGSEHKSKSKNSKSDDKDTDDSKATSKPAGKPTGTPDNDTGLDEDVLNTLLGGSDSNI